MEALHHTNLFNKVDLYQYYNLLKACKSHVRLFKGWRLNIVNDVFIFRTKNNLGKHCDNMLAVAQSISVFKHPGKSVFFFNSIISLIK